MVFFGKNILKNSQKINFKLFSFCRNYSFGGVFLDFFFDTKYTEYYFHIIPNSSQKIMVYTSINVRLKIGIWFFQSRYIPGIFLVFCWYFFFTKFFIFGNSENIPKIVFWTAKKLFFWRSIFRLFWYKIYQVLIPDYTQ